MAQVFPGASLAQFVLASGNFLQKTYPHRVISEKKKQQSFVKFERLIVFFFKFHRSLQSRGFVSNRCHQCNKLNCKSNMYNPVIETFYSEELRYSYCTEAGGSAED